jgi:methyltransferase (TIGR00027 family)
LKAGRASSTAGVVAAGVLLIHHEPVLGRLVSKEAAEAILRLLRARSPLRAAALARGLPYSWFRRVLRAVESGILPGLMLHHAVRKRYIEDETRRALAEGARQVVVLGAGLDTLALRLHREFPRVLFVELDHPTTQDAKRLAFDGLEGAPGENLKFLSADFTRQSADEVLAGCPGYDRSGRALLIMEGVLMYLPPADVDSTFAAARRCGGPGSRFIFTFMEIGSDGRPGFSRRGRLSDLWLGLKGEPFIWGLRPEDLPAFLAQRGFGVRDTPSPADLRRIYLSGVDDRARLAEGERISVAERV